MTVKRSEVTCARCTERQVCFLCFVTRDGGTPSGFAYEHMDDYE